MKSGVRILASAAISLLAASAQAQYVSPQRGASGVWNGVQWQAQSLIVGMGSTATMAGGGEPVYAATGAQYLGVATLIMDYGPSIGAFICTGSLLPDRQSIVTAAHCVTNGATLANPLATTVYFNNTGNEASVYWADAASVAVPVADYFVNPGYTGQVIDQNDVAVLRMAAQAPSWANSYSVYTGSLQSAQFNVAGFGARSDTGGEVGANLGTGRLRQGNNRYDFRFGDSDFGGFWAGAFDDPSLPSAQTEHSWVSDFDSGFVEHDASCHLGGFLCLVGNKYYDQGVSGFREVGIAGGDSGGPGFVAGQIASVNSYGLTFGKINGDVDDSLNSSFGEFSGYVPLSIHAPWINATLVPEPGSYALMALGLAAVGLAARRRAG